MTTATHDHYARTISVTSTLIKRQVDLLNLKHDTHRDTEKNRLERKADGIQFGVNCLNVARIMQSGSQDPLEYAMGELQKEIANPYTDDVDYANGLKNAMETMQEALS